MRQEETGFEAKKAGISIAVVLAMLISGLAMLAAPTTVAEEYVGGSYGGVLRVGLKSQPSSLNPLSMSLNESAKQVMDILYEPLGRIDPYTLKLEPWMAQSWKIDPVDEKIVSVKLKSGIHWHDGTPVTLDDIEYSFGPSGYNINYLSSMTKDIANHSISFHLKAPDSRFFSEMMQMKIVPSGFTATSPPKGCGPFKLESSSADSITVIAFDDHFMARPFIDSMNYTFYPNTMDFSAVNYPYTQIFSGTDPRYEGVYRAAYDVITDKIDFIAWDLLTEHVTLNIEVGGNNTNLLQNSNSTTVKSSGLKQWHLGFNNAVGHPLNDVAIRRAIAHGINKESLLNYDISGGLERADSVVSKFNLPWYNNSISYPQYDLKEAKKILKDAGYDIYTSSGYIAKPGPDPSAPEIGATEISLKLFGPPIEEVTPYTMTTNIVTWFEELGIKVEFVNDTMDVHMNHILNDNFDMFLADQDAITLDPQFIGDIYHSSNIANNKNLLNFAGKHRVENYSLMGQIIDNTTWTAELLHSKLIGEIFVYHNDTPLSNATYDIFRENGTFILKNTYALDYANDTLTITYESLAIDSMIEKANVQMDPINRARYVKDAQALLDEMMPSVPLFSYMVSHAYKTNVFAGWVQTLGGLNNYWTFTSIKNSVKGDTVVTLSSVKNSISSGDQPMNLFVKVQDMGGNPIKVSHMTLSGEGEFGDYVYDESGNQYTVPYTAPFTTSSRTVTLKVEVFTVAYGSSMDTLDITIHPTLKNFNIDISRGATSMPSGNKTTISVIVKDKATSAAITGANVVLTMTPAGLGGYLEEVSGTTDASGEFVTYFGSNNVTIDTTFRISVYVTYGGYVDAEQTTSISVSRDPNIQAKVDRGMLGLPGPSFLTLLALVSCVSVIYAIRRKKRY